MSIRNRRADAKRAFERFADGKRGRKLIWHRLCGTKHQFPALARKATQPDFFS
jgi:hypothetical protein